jgi:hypothetical protein
LRFALVGSSLGRHRAYCRLITHVLIEMLSRGFLIGECMFFGVAVAF